MQHRRIVEREPAALVDEGAVRPHRADLARHQYVSGITSAAQRHRHAGQVAQHHAGPTSPHARQRVIGVERRAVGVAAGMDQRLVDHVGPAAILGYRVVQHPLPHALQRLVGRQHALHPHGDVTIGGRVHAAGARIAPPRAARAPFAGGDLGGRSPGGAAVGGAAVDGEIGGVRAGVVRVDADQFMTGGPRVVGAAGHPHAGAGGRHEDLFGDDPHGIDSTPPARHGARVGGRRGSAIAPVDGRRG